MTAHDQADREAAAIAVRRSRYMLMDGVRGRATENDIADAVLAALSAEGRVIARLTAELFNLQTEKSAVRHYLTCALGYDAAHPEQNADLTILARQIKAMAEMAQARKEWPTSAEASVHEQLRSAEADLDTMRKDRDAWKAKAEGE